MVLLILAKFIVKRSNVLLPRDPNSGQNLGLGQDNPIIHTGVVVVLIIVSIMIVLTILCCLIGRCAANRQHRDEDRDLEVGEDGDIAYLDHDIDGLPASPPPAYSCVDERSDDGDACSVDTLPRYEPVAPPVGVVVIWGR